MDILPAYMSTFHMCAWCPRNLEKAEDPLKLELQMVVSSLWVLGIEMSYGRAANGLKY